MKILIVDDNTDNLEMMKIVLESEKYEIVSAQNGKEALEKLKSEKIDLIISDILMPVMDGFQLCRECKRDPLLNAIGFIFYTATYTDQKDEDLALSMGVQRFIRKPQEPKIFLQQIEEVINKTKDEIPAAVKFDKNDEIEVLNLYSERLVAKLEKRNLELENEIAEHQITARKLVASEERFTLAVDGARDGIWDWDTTSDKVFYSDRYALMLGYDPSEFPANSSGWTNLLHPEDKEQALQNVDDYFASKSGYYESSFRMKAKNGEYRWINARGKALFDDNGNPYRFVGFHTDITEKKEQEQELIKAKEKAEESDKLKTAFLHNISHEIRTPLNGIIGFSELLTDPYLPKERQHQFSDIIISCGNQLLSIVNDIIRISTIETGQEKINEKPTDINVLMQSLKTQHTLNDQPAKVSFILSTLLPKEESYVYTDEIKLMQILTNLVNNAKKFTNEGFIRVSCKKEDQYLKFSVEDTGIGIPESMHEKIFERFYQHNPDKNQLFGGTGLGLSIAKAYVQLLNGTIGMNSIQGKGSEFYFTIPYKAAIKDEKSTMFEHKKSEKKTILVADDEPINIKLIQQYLLNQNITIIDAANGYQAIEACKANPEISLVLMDIKMPLVDGFQAAKKIKELRPDLPIVFQTAFVYQYKNDITANKLADGFIEKPISKSTILELMQKKF